MGVRRLFGGSVNEWCNLERYKFFRYWFLKAENNVFVQIEIEKKILSVWWIQSKQTYSSVFSLYNFVFELSLPELGNSDSGHVWLNLGLPTV